MLIIANLLPNIKHNNVFKIAIAKTLNFKPYLANIRAGGKKDIKIKIKANLIIKPDSGIAFTKADWMEIILAIPWKFITKIAALIITSTWIMIVINNKKLSEYRSFLIEVLSDLNLSPK